MSWLGKLFSRSAGDFVGAAGKAIKQFVTTDADRLAFEAEMESLLQKRD